MAPKNSNLARGAAMEEADKEQYLLMSQRHRLNRDSQLEARNTKYNMSKIQEGWLKIMRSAKTKQLKKQVEIISQNHERDVDRKDAILQMLDRDLDEAEEQHQVAVRSHLLNTDKLLEVQQSRLLALEDDFKREVATLMEEFRIEKEHIQEKHALEKRELTIIVEQVEKDEKNREQADITDHQSQFEMIRNRNIEEDHQMKSNLEEKIEDTRAKCKEKLQLYQNSTESFTADYKQFLQRDANLSKQVERKLRQVERMTASIAHWKLKISQNRSECEERNAQLRTEKDHIAKHFQELKAKMNHFRSEEKKRLADLTQNARNCTQSLNDQLGMAERIIKTAELCRKFETEREKVLPFYLSRDLMTEFEEGELDFGDEDLKEEIRKELTDVGIDEWTYLDNFFKRFNKVKLDHLAIEQEGKRLNKENVQLRSILKQFLDGVSVNEDVLSQPNPLLVVNGKVNLNHVPVKRIGEKKVFVEAAHHRTNVLS
jgi:sulfur relay (sulfurtransferase) DsrC/TusE family protein